MLNVSIVTYRTDLDEMRQCLDMLTSQRVNHIYVVDNSADEAMEALCREYAKVDYTANENIGYGRAHNKALRRSLDDKRVRYHLVLNSDVTFDPSIIDKILDYMDAHPEVGQLQPAVYFPNGSVQFSSRLLPTPYDLIGRRFLPGFTGGKRNSRYVLQNFDRTKALNVPFQQGSFMMLRTDVLSEVGLFDERFFMYGEDVDLSRRMHAKSVTLYWPEVQITHVHRASSYRSWRMLRIHCVNMIRYFNKWGWFFDAERRRVNRAAIEGARSAAGEEE